jgi:hypothetical protein
MMMGATHSRCWLEEVSVEAMEHLSSFRSILSSISTDIPDVETDPKLFDRDRVAIADPFRDRNPVLGTPVLVEIARRSRSKATLVDVPQSMCSVMMLSSLMRKLLKFIFSVLGLKFQLKNI